MRDVVKDWSEVDENDVKHIESDDIANEYMDYGVNVPIVRYSRRGTRNRTTKKYMNIGLFPRG